MICENHYFGNLCTPSADWRHTRRSGRFEFDRPAAAAPRCARSAPPATMMLQPVMDCDEQDAERWDGLA